LTRTFANLRIAPSESLAGYLYNSHLLVEFGNGAFAQYMSEAKSGRQESTPQTPESLFDSPWVVFHSWRDGFIELDDRQALAVAMLISAGRAVAPLEVTPLEHAMVTALDSVGWLDPDPLDLAAIARRTRSVFIAMQNLAELHSLLRRVQRLRPRVIVEIGTARGGLLYALAQVAHPRARLVSIDLPGAMNGGGQFEFEREIFASFAAPTQEVVCIVGSSHGLTVPGALDDALAGSEIDLLVIDGDHSYEGVKSDLIDFSARVSPFGLVALHDICLMPEAWGPATGVGQFWNELQSYFAGTLDSIIDPEGVSLPQRPPGREWAWGFGLLTGDQARSWSTVHDGGRGKRERQLSARA
jgi:predicted O-methyltransferase YrrM